MTTILVGRNPLPEGIVLSAVEGRGFDIRVPFDSAQNEVGMTPDEVSCARSPRRSGPLGGPDVCQERSGLLTYKKFRRAKRKEAIYCPLEITIDSIK